MYSRHISRVRSRLAAEDGIAVAVSIIILAIALMLVGVAIAQSTGVSTDANEDRRVKRAVQGADAGIDAAIYRLNKMDVERTDPSRPCVVVGAGGELTRTGFELFNVNGKNWCPAVTENLGGGASYSYRVSNACRPRDGTCKDGSGASTQRCVLNSSLQRTIVSTGTVGGETRRVFTTICANNGEPLFGDDTVRSLVDLELYNQAYLDGNARSNGNIIVDNNSTICGNAIPGPPPPEKGVVIRSAGVVCPEYTTEPADAPFSLSAVDQGDVQTNNDNWRICNSANGGDGCGRTNKITWTPPPPYSTSGYDRRLIVGSNAYVTLGGNRYSLCYLKLESNSELIVALKTSSTPVQIYIDAPENCTGPAPNGSVDISSNARITNLNGAAVPLQIFVVGSSNPSTPTYVNLNSNLDFTSSLITIYAPRSTVNMASNTKITGAVAAQRVVMNGNSRINKVAATNSIESRGLFATYKRQDYRECDPTVSPSDAPDARC